MRINPYHERSIRALMGLEDHHPDPLRRELAQRAVRLGEAWGDFAMFCLGKRMAEDRDRWVLHALFPTD